MINTKYSTTKDWVMLFIAIAVTVLFIYFAEEILTCFYYGTDKFADAMYNFNLYFSLAVYISIVVWVFNILYYWVLDNIKLSSFTGWALFCIFALVCAPGIAYFYPQSVFDEKNLDFISQLPSLALTIVPLTLVLFFIVSLGTKGLSKNCSTRPF